MIRLGQNVIVERNPWGRLVGRVRSRSMWGGLVVEVETETEVLRFGVHELDVVPVADLPEPTDEECARVELPAWLSAR